LSDSLCRDADNESDANEDSESIISVADFTTFLFKAKLLAKHHGKTSLLGTVMELDDKFTNDFLLTAPRQCKISDVLVLGRHGQY
jgi:hypothetical protein